MYPLNQPLLEIDTFTIGTDGAFSKPAKWQKSYPLSTAREWDAESSTYYYRARNQDPRIGRFLSADPIEYDDGLNLYTYVENNPVIYVDPFGNATIYKAGTCNEGDICCLEWIYKWDEQKYKSADECISKLKERYRILFLTEYIGGKITTFLSAGGLKIGGRLAWGAKIASLLKNMGWVLTGYEVVSYSWERMFKAFCNTVVCTKSEPADVGYVTITIKKGKYCEYKYWVPVWYCLYDAKYGGK